MILAGDIGGTKTNLALFEERGDDYRPVHEQRFTSRTAEGLESIIEEFLAGRDETVTAATFGMAGPVADGRIEMAANIPWAVDERDIRALLGIEPVELFNDMIATAYGVLTLTDDEVIILNPGVERDDHQAVIAAGTGLGEASLYYCEETKNYVPIPSERGHADFAPRNELEHKFLRYMWREQLLEHVCYDLILSGRGFWYMYQFFLHRRRKEIPAWFREEREQQKNRDAAPVITRNALNGRCKECKAALDLFVDIYGSEAGNQALNAAAFGGVFVGGGIAPKIKDKLVDGAFVNAFKDKDFFGQQLADTPVRLVLDEKTAIRGAAYYARRLLEK